MQCIHEKDGCQWNGELSELNSHLETCLYDLIDCPNKCGKKVANVSVDEHLNVFCISMPRSCRDCGITTTGQDQLEHRNVCLKYPVPCPNDCDVGYIIRGEMDKHVSYDCIKSILPCPLKHVGCRYEGSKSTLTKHMETFNNEHLLLVSGTVAEQANQIADLKNKISQLELEKNQVETDLKSKILEQQKEISCIQQELQDVKGRVFVQKTPVDKKPEQETKVDILEPVQLKQLEQLKLDVYTIKETKIRTLEAGLRNLERKQLEHNMKLNLTITDCCYTWIIDNFRTQMSWAKDGIEEELKSPEFYLHLNGYRLQGSIYLNGNGPSSKKHISLYLALLSGKNDDELIWPFPYDIKYKIIDQNPNFNQAKDAEEFMDTAETKKDRQNFKKPRPDDDNGGYGYDEFLSHQELYNRARQFIKNNTLKVQFTFIRRE